ncbi:CdvA-like protein [Hyperthermus butylicus]|uniref:Conserved crenarchaeal protein n=1 Tax=Hyperthermus butylicus (strain DSM 5456 / JCM 9403 / PLM1-5) TaxID=415426 RepID=A2BKY8_HYPBU|nr:CdvA-like protein [Hyperthermus butylicus]ABM80649.1 conserved crenarchaeal protein [Hyperthermus butylicus DSM 5456]
MARAPLTVDVVQQMIGETVYDPYGRVIGKLVSLESDIDGTVQQIVVETENKDIKFIPSEAVEVSEGRIIVWPEWKVLAYKVLASYQRALKRLKGLEEMYSRNEIPAAVYQELRRKLNQSLARVRDEAKKLKSLIKSRIDEIDDNNLKLDRAIANLKVSYMAGEISEKAYKTAIEYLRSAKDSNTRELEDLKKTGAKLESLETGTIEISKTAKKKESKPASREEKHEAKPPAIEGIQPIPVKVIEG